MTPAERLAALLVAQNQLDSAMATQPRLRPPQDDPAHTNPTDQS